MDPIEDAAKNHCNTRELTVAAPARLDLFLLQQLPDYSRDGLMRLLARGGVQVNGELRVAGHRLKGGETVRLQGDLERLRIPAGEGRLDILFEDGDLIAIDKPAGQLAHPTAQEREGTALNLLRGYCGVRVSLLHRLDRGTSGVLLAAKNKTAAFRFGSRFASREVRKKYLAIVRGIPEWSRVTLHHSIERVSGRTPAWNVGGHREAATRLRVIGPVQGGTLLEAIPETGRTNQIRIHCAAAGFPIAGDTAYGGTASSRLYLHAWELRIDDLRIVAPAPVEFQPAPMER